MDLDDVISFDTIESHLANLSDQEVVQLFGDDLPPSITANPSKANVLELIRSGFFQQSKNNLSSHLKKQNGAGYLLAQSFGLDYEGEGISNFLNGIRKATKKKGDELSKDNS